MAGTNDRLLPLVEVVVGAQFAPLAKLTSGHLGWFWRTLGEEWPSLTDAVFLEDQFEQFGEPRFTLPPGLRLRIEPLRWSGRLQIGHADKDKLIQIQATRFMLNWRRGNGDYPGFGELLREFESYFDRFAGFVESAGLGAMSVNQWELTYVDAFLKGDDWHTPSDWPQPLPGLFGNLSVTNSLVLEHRSAEWTYEIPPHLGRLHVSGRPGRVESEEARDGLMLQMTARGPVGKQKSETLRSGLELGHSVIREAFNRVISPDIRSRMEGAT